MKTNVSIASGNSFTLGNAAGTALTSGTWLGSVTDGAFNINNIDLDLTGNITDDTTAGCVGIIVEDGARLYLANTYGGDTVTVLDNFGSILDENGEKASLTEEQVYCINYLLRAKDVSAGTNDRKVEPGANPAFLRGKIDSSLLSE